MGATKLTRTDGRLSRGHWVVLTAVAGFCLVLFLLRDSLRAARWSYLLTRAGSEEQRRSCALRLAECGEAAVSYVERLLQSPDSGVRLAAIEAAAGLATPRLVSSLIPCAHDGDETVSAAAFKGLARIGEARSREVLSAILRDADEAHAMRAACALAEMGHPEAWTTLRRGLREHPSPSVRVQIIELFAASLVCEAAPELLNALADGAIADRPTMTQRYQQQTTERLGRRLERELGIEGQWTLTALPPRSVSAYAAATLTQWTGQPFDVDPADTVSVDEARVFWERLLMTRERVDVTATRP